MKRYCLPTVLVLSLLFNAGVLLAVGFQFLKNGKLPYLFGQEPGHVVLEDYLGLNEEQLPLWRKKEQAFMEELNAAWVDVRGHRERMIREIFSDAPDPQTVEHERQAIASLQEQQQRQVIHQLMNEREILDAHQRRLLVKLLLDQGGGSMEELSKQLHQH